MQFDHDFKLNDEGLDYSLELVDRFMIFRKFSYLYNKMNRGFQAIQLIALIITGLIFYFGFNFIRQNIANSEFDPTRTVIALIAIIITVMAVYTRFIVFRFSKEEIIEAETIIRKMLAKNNMRFSLFVNNELLTEGVKMKGVINTITNSLILSIIAGVVGTVSQNISSIWFEKIEPNQIRPDKFTITFFILTLLVSFALMLTFFVTNLRNRNLFYETLKHMKLENQVRLDKDDPLELLTDTLKKIN